MGYRHRNIERSMQSSEEKISSVLKKIEAGGNPDNSYAGGFLYFTGDHVAYGNPYVCAVFYFIQARDY